MSTVVPPTPLPPPAQVALPRLSILSLPPPLQALPLGSRVDVTVSQVLPDNVLQLSSNAGDIRITAPGGTAIKPGDSLILQILSGGNAPKGQLTLPNGRPPAVLAPPSASSLLTPGVSAPTTTGPSAPATIVVRPGATLTATLLQPISLTGGTKLATPVNAAQAGAQASPQVFLNSAAGGTIPKTILGTPPAAGQSAATSQTSSAANPTNPATVQTLPGGSTVVLKVTGYSPPTAKGGPLTPPPGPGGGVSLAPGASLQGTVTGRQGVALTVVQTQAGAISLPTADALPPGTKLTFEVINPPRPPLTPTTAISTLPGSHLAPLLDGDWPALDEALTALRDIAPGAHTHVMQNALPRADAQLTANVLFFLSALRGGDLKGWIGDGPLRILERARPDLAGRIREDLGQMTRQMDDPVSGEWRLMGIPFFNGEELDRIRLLIRDQDNEDDDENRQKGGSRFVIDLDLTRLGHIQIDGLVGDQGKRLDLVVRSDNPLDSAIRQDIRLLYINALEVTGIDGSVGFQAAPANFVDVAPAPSPASPTSGGVTV